MAHTFLETMLGNTAPVRQFEGLGAIDTPIQPIGNGSTPAWAEPAGPVPNIRRTPHYGMSFAARKPLFSGPQNPTEAEVM